MITEIFQKITKNHNGMQVSLINTRVMLETGVNLKAVRPEQDRDMVLAQKVRSVLRDMGISI